MKKIFALLLIAAICVSFAACGQAGNTTNKYVGTYINEDNKYSKDAKYNGTISTLVLNEDGTGYCKTEVSEVGSDLKNMWAVGDIQEESDITWTDNGEYITVSYDTKEYYEIFVFIRRSEPEKSFSKSDYELKGGQLFYYGGSGNGTGYYKTK
jgi:hypothetical protein